LLTVTDANRGKSSETTQGVDLLMRQTFGNHCTEDSFAVKAFFRVGVKARPMNQLKELIY